MPQDDTTPIMPTPTMPLAQDNSLYDPSSTDASGAASPSASLPTPVIPDPTATSSADSSTTAPDLDATTPDFATFPQPSFAPTSMSVPESQAPSTLESQAEPAPESQYTPNSTSDPAPMPDPVPASAPESTSDPAATFNQSTPEYTVAPDQSASQPNEITLSPANLEIYAAVAAKIGEARNVLIALSSDPSVDEMAAAIGITLYLDRLGKRATAIYSGTTPNALEFLKPEETFESTADTLQDFVIAINKEKADHLRYKLDGEYVKIYITPYRHRVSEEDLEFSYGDYNVDLVIALDVANGIDLDSALREHGRIMHDAVIINATTGNPGKFGEIEWSDKNASSVSEMIATLLYVYGGENPVAKDEATAYLTGIVAATNRFANAKTTPATMRLCSKLMESGANQQLVSKNITPDVDNELLNFSSASNAKPSRKNDPTKLEIEHDDESTASASKAPKDKPSEIDADVTKKEHTLLDDLKAAEQSLAEASAETVPEDNSAALEINSRSSSSGVPEIISDSSEHSFTNDDKIKESEKYSQMLQDALGSSESSPESPQTITSAPDATDLNSSSTPETSSVSDSNSESSPVVNPASNPALENTPKVADAPEINGVPEMNFMPPADADILPPPPTPPIDLDAELPTPSLPGLSSSDSIASSSSQTTDPEAPTSLGPQPAMQDQIYRPQAADPSVFKIPGM